MDERTSSFLNEVVDARNFSGGKRSVQQVRNDGETLEDLWLPTVAVRRKALNHNLERFQEWCRVNGVEYAPHGKTTMSPQIWHAQLDHGAWGITAANAAQARVMVDMGVRNVLLANEVISIRQAEWLASAMNAHSVSIIPLIDSEFGIDVMELAAKRAGARVDVLVEVGVTSRRTGVRKVSEALDLGLRIRDSKHLNLVGVEGYEGVFPAVRDEKSLAEVRAWGQIYRSAVEELENHGCLAEVLQPILSLGGSAFPDLAVEILNQIELNGRDVQRIVRSGCYVTHDHLSYERVSPLASRYAKNPLAPALSCFAEIISCPEEGLCIAALGKRDVPVDIDLPIVIDITRDGESIYDGERCEVYELNDHHMFIRSTGIDVIPGDRIEVGLSHPCTTFDRWRIIPVLDEEALVVDAIRTVF